MTFEPDPADLALSSIPGHETFDPRRHRFSEEELKPQPIMKKARKVQVPEEQKVSVQVWAWAGSRLWEASPRGDLQAPLPIGRQPSSQGFWGQILS